MEDRPSKKELKELRKLQELERDTAEKRQNTMKWIIIGIISIVFLGFFGGLIFLAKQQKAEPVKLSSSGWVRGEADAKVTLTEFSDLQCPACKAYESTVQNVLKDYKGKVKLLYKHFPLSNLHKNAEVAVHAAEAAGKQNKFWEMHDILFDKQEEWQFLPDPTEKFVIYAQEIKIDPEKFKSDMKDPEIAKMITKFQDEGIAAGVNATPTFFVNDRIVESGAQYLDIKKIIDEELKK